MEPVSKTTTQMVEHLKLTLVSPVSPTSNDSTHDFDAEDKKKAELILQDIRKLIARTVPL